MFCFIMYVCACINVCFIIYMFMYVLFRCVFVYVLFYCICKYVLVCISDHVSSAKRCANGGSDFWLSIKSVWNTLSCCCFVCAFIIGQYHSGNNMSSKSEATGEILFLKVKSATKFNPWKRTRGSRWVLSMIRSRTWRIKTLPQSPICTEEISLYTVHIKSIISKFCFWS